MDRLALCQELVEVAAAFLDALRGGDDAAMTALADRREEILASLNGRDEQGLANVSDPAEAQQVAAALEQTLQLDAAAVDALEARKAEVHAQLVAIDHGRRSLAGYRGAPPAGPSHLDRLG
jgi:hypothetical protein